MSVQNTTVVDRLGLEKETGAILLLVLDDLDWSNEEEHLRLLQAKLNTYLAFIESGEVFEHFTSDLRRRVSETSPIKVLVLAKHDLPFAGSHFMTNAESTFRGAGFSLVHEVLRIP